MKRDSKLFSHDLVIEVSGEENPIDTSHIYSGELYGKCVSFKGSVSDSFVALLFFNSKPLCITFWVTSQLKRC